MALEQNIKTSVDSISRFVAHQRKSLKPKVRLELAPEPIKIESILPEIKGEPHLALDTFDSIVETLYALRKYITETVEENSRLRERVKRIKELVE